MIRNGKGNIINTINEAKAVAAKIKYHNDKRIKDEALEAYYTYRAEARACGYEVESFDEYFGLTNLKDEKMRMMILREQFGEYE